MSAPKEGMKIVNEAQALTEKMQKGVITAPPVSPQDPQDPAQGGAQAVQFQRKFIARDAKDDEMNMRQQLMDENGMTPFGQAYYDDSIGRWVQRKEATAEAANFNGWFNRNFNKNNLADRAFAQQINPEFFNQVDREMMEKAQVITKIKGIQNRGPQNEEDTYMLYLLDTGKVVLPDDWDRLGPSVYNAEGYQKAQREQEQIFAQGLIRLPKFLTSSQQTDRAIQNRSVGGIGNPMAAVNSVQYNQWMHSSNPNRPLSQGPNTAARNVLKFLGRPQ